MSNESCVLLDECDEEELEIGDSFKDEDGNLDIPQLFDDLETPQHLENDIRVLKGMLAVLEARVIHEP